MLARIGVAATAVLSLMSCDRQPDNQALQQTVSYSPRQPGSFATPTHETSFQLLALDGPTRFANFQQLMLESDKPCDAVTSAVLKGGLEGTDEWRVRCANSGDWSVWIQSHGPIEVVRAL